MMMVAGCAAPTPISTQPAATAARATDSPAAQASLDAARKAIEAGNFDEAIKQAQEAIAASPDNSVAHYVLGNAYNQMAPTQADIQQRQATLAKAVDAYLKAIALDPQNDAALTNLATVYYQNGQFDEAQKRVEQALAIKPNDSTSQYVLGTILLQRNPEEHPEALDQAQAAFEAATRSDPQMSAAFIGLANVYLFKGDAQKALEYAQKGVDLSQSAPNPYAYWALAQAQCVSGDFSAGAQTIEKIYTFSNSEPLFLQQVQALAERCK
jgi:tetratricopeptide (TPR) repeat protein